MWQTVIVDFNNLYQSQDYGFVDEINFHHLSYPTVWRWNITDYVIMMDGELFPMMDGCR